MVSRLPAVTDLLILRRREAGREPAPAGWLNVVQMEIDGFQVGVNAHFAGDHAWCLGRLGAGNSMWRGGDLNVTADGNLTEQLPAALSKAIRAAGTQGLTWTPATDVDVEPEPEIADSEMQDGHIVRRGGRFHRAETGVLVAHHVPRTQARELAALISLRDAALAVLNEETRTDDDTARLASLRARLRDFYGKYVRQFGYLNRVTQRRTGRNDPVTGEELLARIRPPMGGFRVDPHSPLVFALEDYDPEAAVGAPAPILTQRVITRREPPSSADSPADALAICIDAHGHADLAEISRLLGASRRDARAQLGELAFDDPDTARLVPAAEYLSGDVRAKLAAAEAAVMDDARFEVNVAALRQVIPADLTPGEIDARLGAAWIDADVVEQFLRETLEDTWVKVEHPGGQIWSVTGKDWTVLATARWGTKRASAIEIAQRVLEQRRIEVRDRVYSRDGDKYVLNVEETAAAAEKAVELQERFAEWVWQDPDRAKRLARIYNDLFNGIVLRSYDDVRLTLPGLSTVYTLRDHQVAAIARGISEPAVLLAHEVGAGKTLEMVCVAMELRRLGLARKPAVVVPGHMLDQFAGEWMRAYPLARILITRKEDLQGDRRRRLVARVATGDWDAVIMSSSTFERIALSPKAQAAYLQREVDQFEEWLKVAKKGDGRTVKRIQLALRRAQERVKAKLDSVKDPGITFEQTGIDYVFIDEAHRYKNLRTPSAIPDAGIDGSQRATDLDAKLCWLRNRAGDRVVTFATATPVANSITEIHVMQRYLRPDMLEERGLLVFDSWAATFGEVVTEVELAPEGGGSFRLNTRFARFRNVPELLRLFHVLADVKLADDLNLPVPLIADNGDGVREPVIVAIDMPDALNAYVGELCERAEKIRSRSVSPEEDNMLKVTGDGRRAALDMRLVGLRQDEPGKIAAAADRIHGIWAASRDRAYPGPGGQPSPIRGALQLVFCDLGTPREGWNAYRELRDQLAGLGMPTGMIRFIHDAKTDQAKAALFAACRSGNVAVLVGSTEKMGVGTNVQDRAIALHHLDAPWRPADVAQRDGRILRQGNLNPEVRMYRYVVTGSFDGYSWQILARKAGFIGQVMRGRLDVREIEDIGDTALSYAEVKAIATGNPLLMEQAAAQAALAKLQRAERAHHRNQWQLSMTVRDMTARTDSYEREASAAAAALARRTDTRGDLFTMTVAGVTYDKRTEAAEALAAKVADVIDQWTSHRTGSYTERVGELAGFPVKVTTWMGMETVLVSMSLDDVPQSDFTVKRREVRSDGVGLVRRLEHRLSRLEFVADDAASGLARCTSEAVRAAADRDAPFPRSAELAAALAEVERIRVALDALARKTDAAQVA